MTGIEQLKEQLTGEQIPAWEKEPLSRHTTFRIGGPARLFCVPENENQLVRTVNLCRSIGVRYYLLGKGSNTLFCDEGYDGAVILAGGGLDKVWREDSGELWAGCGTSLAKLCRAAADDGLTGLEFAYGIPGSVGGAVYMNAGAYGGEMKDVLCKVRSLTTDGKIITFTADQLRLGYRTSRFEQEGGVILAAGFALQDGDKAEILARMEDFLARRTQKQPLDKPSAGSTFKRPQGAFAAALIEQCGLKGYRVGDAAVSEKHSGFVVNLGHATAEDVLRVAEDVARIVREKTGIQLEKEIRVVR